VNEGRDSNSLFTEVTQLKDKMVALQLRLSTFYKFITRMLCRSSMINLTLLQDIQLFSQGADNDRTRELDKVFEVLVKDWEDSMS